LRLTAIGFSRATGKEKVIPDGKYVGTCGDKGETSVLKRLSRVNVSVARSKSMKQTDCSVERFTVKIHRGTAVTRIL
jgi:hypothetical protein